MRAALLHKSITKVGRVHENMEAVMDGRETLDMMNNEVLAAIRQNVAPWRKPVATGEYRPRMRNAYADNEMPGLGGWYLEVIADRNGWQDPLWWSVGDAGADCLAVREGETPVEVIEFDVIDGRLSAQTQAFYCGGQVGERQTNGYVSHPVETDELCNNLFAAMGIQREPLTQSGIARLCEHLEAGEMGRPDFRVRPIQALGLRSEIVLGIVTRHVGQNDVGADQVEAGAVARALEEDPFWLARVAMEAEFAANRLLAPVDHPREFGAEQKRREELELHFDQLRPTEKRQYLSVPFADNDEAKTKGARFDRVAKSWYVPTGRNINDFAKWDRPLDISPAAEFAEMMRHHGLLVEGEAIMDGEPHRVMLEGQRPGSSPAGSYTGYLDGRPAGHFINFRDGDGKAVKWVASGHRVDPELRSATVREVEEKREARRRELATKQDAAATRAGNIWKNLVVSDDYSRTHRYLQDKGVKAYDGIGISRDGQTLYVPAHDINGRLRSLQMIYWDWEDRCLKKRFLKDSRKEGCFCILERDRAFGQQPVLIAEGYATAASVLEATGRPVVVAFDAHNLKPVAEALRSEIRNEPFIFIADDDRGLEVNKGVEFAVEAGRAVGGSAVIVPAFDVEGLFNGLSDFNDLHQHAGIEVVGRQVKKAMSRFLRNFRVYKIGTDEDRVIIHQSDEFAPSLPPVCERFSESALSREKAQKGRGR